MYLLNAVAWTNILLCIVTMTLKICALVKVMTCFCVFNNINTHVYKKNLLKHLPKSSYQCEIMTPEIQFLLLSNVTLTFGMSTSLNMTTQYKVKQIFLTDWQRGILKSLSAHCLYTGLKNFITNCSSVYWYFTVFILAIVKSAKYKPRQSLRLKSIYMGEPDYMLF